MARPRKYPKELLDRGARVVIDNSRPIAHVARDLGIPPETLRRHLRQVEADEGLRPDLPTAAEREEIKELRKEVFELRRANEILKSASVFVAKELDEDLACIHRSGWPGELIARWRLGGGVGGARSLVWVSWPVLDRVAGLGLGARRPWSRPARAGVIAAGWAECRGWCCSGRRWVRRARGARVGAPGRRRSQLAKASGLGDAASTCARCA